MTSEESNVTHRRRRVHTSVDCTASVHRTLTSNTGRAGISQNSVGIHARLDAKHSLIVEGRTELSKVLTEVSVAAVVVLLRAGGQM